MPESSPKPKPTESAVPRGRWRRAFFGSLLFLIVLTTGLSVLLFTADLGVFKPQIERWVSESTGRELRIDGSLLIELGGTSRVRAERVRFENAAWAGESAMLEVGVLHLRFDLWSILKDRFIVELVEIDDARIRLVTSDENGSNLAFGVREEQEDVSEDGVAVLLERLDIDNVELSYESTGRVRPLVARIDSLRQRHGPDDFLQLSLDGAVGGRRVELNGRVGTWSALLDGENIQYDIEGEFDTAVFSSRGRIDDLAEPSRPRLEFSFVGPDVDHLTRMFGLRQGNGGNIDLSGSLMPTPDGPLLLRAAGNVAEAEIEASGSFSDLQHLDEMSIDLLVSGPNLGRLFSLFGSDQVREAPFMIDIDATRDGSLVTVERANMLFGEARFDLTAKLPHFPSLDDGNVDLDVNGPDIARLRYLLGLPGAASGPFSLSFGLVVSPLGEESIRLQGQSNLLRVEVSGPLGPAPQHFGSRLQFRVESDDLARLGGAWGIDNLPDRPVALTGAVQTTESGLRTVDPLVADVNGVIASVEGLIVPRDGLLGSDVEFSLTGPDLSALAAAFAVNEGVPKAAYVFDGQLQIIEDGYRVRTVNSNIGSSLVDIQGLVSTNRAAAGTRLDFSARGPAFEEIIGGIADFEVVPGPYDLSGRVELQPGKLGLSDVTLGRERGELKLDLSLGLPLSERWADFDLRSTGSDVRNLLRGINGFEAYEAPFRLAAVGQWRAGDWSFERFNIDVADATVSARGTLEFDDDAASTEFRFSGNVPSLANIGMWNGRRMRDQRVSWDGRVSGGDGQLRAENLSASLGDSDIRGTVAYRLGDVPELDVDIHSESVVFAPLLEQGEKDDDPEPGFEDGRVIPDLPISFAALRSFNADVRLQIGELVRDSLHVTDIEFAATLQDGAFEMPAFGFNGRAGRFDARAGLKPGEESAQASVEIVARDFALGLSELNRDLAMTNDVIVKLDAAGTDVRSLFANARGAAFVNVRGGRISNNRFMETLYGNLFDEVLAAINPFFSADAHTELECVVLPYAIDDGQMVSVPNTFISTGKIRIASKGRIDLDTEKIDINVRTTPKRSLGISAGEIVNPYVKIVGTLGSPRLAVDETGVLLSGGAAVVTGGLSILARAAWDRLSRAQDPCAETTAQAIEALGDRFPVWGADEAVDIDR